MSEQIRNIKPLYAARVENLVWAATVSFECLDCDHSGAVPVEFIRRKHPAWAWVTQLTRHARCTACGHKGHAVIDARQALGHNRVTRTLSDNGGAAGPPGSP